MGNSISSELSAETELRRLAEEKLTLQPTLVNVPFSDIDTSRLNHELQVHQVELEMQNRELQEARDGLEMALEKYTDLYDFAPVGYVTLDCNGTIRAVNLAAACLLGGVRTKLVGRSFGLFIAIPDRSSFTNFLSQVLTCKIKESCELELLSKTAQPITVQIEATASASGNEFRLALINTSGHRQVENALHESERRMYRLAEMAVDGIIMLDDRGAVTFCNSAAESMFGCPVAEITDLYFHRSVISKHLLDAVKQAIAHSRLHGTEPPIDKATEVITHRKDGTEFSLELSISALEFKGKWHAIGIMRDITERKQLEEDLQKTHDQLEQILDERTDELSCANVQQQETTKTNRRLVEVSRTKSDFLANMSHELRTPLNSVIGFSEVLQDRMFGPINDKQQEYVTNILTSGKHLLSLINDILDLSKVESGKMELELSTFSLRETLDDSLTMLSEKAQKNGIALRLELAPQADVQIEADQRKLKQILFNLLSNAVKFTPTDGSVDVYAVKDGHHIEFIVADTGMGIRHEDIPKLFQAFTQLESVYTKEYEGTGLGLALTKQLVELHGGKIWVESKFGAGSRFRFTIPLTQVVSISNQR
jgi:PAS domain S-box-containing protein